MLGIVLGNGNKEAKEVDTIACYYRAYILERRLTVKQ